MPPEEEEASESFTAANGRCDNARKLAPKSSASPPLHLQVRTEDQSPEDTTSRGTSRANGSPCIHLSPRRMPIPTNSVGNVYFLRIAAMWVGKTRELF